MLFQIRLELARTEDHPAGDPQHGYEFIAPLDDNGMLDADNWRSHRDRCTVRRFEPGEADEHGHLMHTKGRQWAFHYDLDADQEADESGFKFSSHKFLRGEYVSITEHDDVTRPFKVSSSRPAKI